MPVPCRSGVPKVSVNATVLTIREGGNLTFECQVIGVPLPSIRWRTEHLHSNFILQVRCNEAFRVSVAFGIILKLKILTVYKLYLI